MSMINRFRLGVLVVIVAFIFISCASLSDLKLKENPDFMRDSHRYSVIHPLTKPSLNTVFKKSSKPQTFIFKNVQSKDDYHFKVHWAKETLSKTTRSNDNERTMYTGIFKHFLNHIKHTDHVDIHDMEEGDVARIKDYVVHRIDITNSVDSTDYVILGELSFFRKIEKDSENTTFESTNLIYPVEFFIFEKGKDVGKTVIKRSSLSSSPFLTMDILIQNNLLKVDFQEQFNKRKVSMESKEQLIAFFDLKPASFISTKLKGEVMIKSNLSENEITRIFTSYIITDILQKAIRL